MLLGYQVHKSVRLPKKFDLVHQTAFPRERVGCGRRLEYDRVWQSMTEYDRVWRYDNMAEYNVLQNMAEYGRTWGVMQQYTASKFYTTKNKIRFRIRFKV